MTRNGTHGIALIVALAAALVTALVGARDATADEFLVFTDDRAAHSASLSQDAAQTVVDTGGAFAADPLTGSGSSVTRSGSIDGRAYTYVLYDLQFDTTPTGTITPGVVGGDTGALSSVFVESPASQAGVSGLGSWGLDSGAVSTSRQSGVLLDFTTTPGGAGVGHVGLDLIDFETGGNAQLRLYAAGVLVFSTNVDLGGNGGNQEVRFLGVTANLAEGGQRFDQMAVLVNSPTDRWAADRFSFGVAANPEPGTWVLMTLGVGVLVFARRRSRAQLRKSERG